MDQLWIGSIRYDGRFEQGPRLIARHAGKKAMKPARELALIHYSAHEVRFHERGRKEILAARFPGRRIIHVAAKIVAAAFDDERLQFSVAGGARVVERERQPERRV